MTKSNKPCRLFQTAALWTTLFLLAGCSDLLSLIPPKKAPESPEKAPESPEKTPPEKAPKAKFQVSFDAKGGSRVPSQTVQNGKKANAPSIPTKNNHTFAGWYKDSALSKRFNFSQEVITRNTTLYAKWRISSGAKLKDPRAIAVAEGAAYVLEDSDAGTIVKVDLKSGDRSIVSRSANNGLGTVGTGPDIQPTDIAVTNGVGYVVSGSSLVRIDLATGDREFVVRRGTGGYMALAVHDGSAYLSPWWERGLEKVDLSSGSKTLISRSGEKGSGPVLARSDMGPTGITILAEAAYLKVYDVIYKVELSNGNRSTFYKFDRYRSAIHIDEFRGLKAHNGELYAIDRGSSDYTNRLVKIFPGGRGAIVSFYGYNFWSWTAAHPRGSPSPSNRGKGIVPKWLDGLAIEENTAYVTDRTLKAVIKVDLNSGDRTIVSQ